MGLLSHFLLPKAITRSRRLRPAAQPNQTATMGLCVYQNTVAEQGFSTDSPAVAFLATLMESHVAGESVDLPAADEFTLHILAAVAQKEATAISTRTREALAAKKAGVSSARPPS